MHATPDTPTIATLVEWANSAVAEQFGRPVTAADTLKNVMVKLHHPDVKTEIVGIGVPGDREVDDKRLAMIEYKSVNETNVWLMDVATGARRRVLPPEGTTPSQPIATFNLQFSRDGKSLVITTNWTKDSLKAMPDYKYERRQPASQSGG